MHTFILYVRMRVCVSVYTCTRVVNARKRDEELARARARALERPEGLLIERVSKIEVHGAPHGETAVNNL